MRKYGLMLLCLLLLLGMSCSACAEGEWFLFSDSVPEELLFTVNDYTGTVTLTFLGDCTLGTQDGVSGRANSFTNLIEEHGMSWPFRNLVSLTAHDDLTVANLEGVLTDRSLTKVEKSYNFKGPTAYTEILHEGSIECVNLANNHSHDYGTAGYKDTKAALTGAEIAFFGEDCVAVWKYQGVRIGFIGAYYALSGSRYSVYKKQIALLQQAGCNAIITVMHAGLEHNLNITPNQRGIAEKAAKLGSCLVVGHHPHVAQGYELVDGIPVAYSLGNCSFGGAIHPGDTDSLVLQVELSFEDGEPVEEVLHFYPISITGNSKYNDCSPVLLTGKDAARVLKDMETSTGYTMPEFTEAAGSVVRVSLETE